MTAGILAAPVLQAASEEVNVAAGWIALIIVLAIGAFVVFLYFSMNKQLRRIKVPKRDEADGLAAESPTQATGESAS
ncbi:MAG: hypothetical protein HZY75_04995 [Nocardioidaceae bacterium]|nr:MAG: hypothetical protein HZY75_04995 [Nocardioidaceae bacterium]